MSPCILLGWLAGAGPAAVASDLPPEAAAHNERGIAAIRAGEVEQGIDELERAYAAMPDPLLYRAGRDKVLGSLRGALNQRHAATGDPAYLRRLRALLQGHLDGLLATPASEVLTEDIAGTREALREVDAALASACTPRPGPAAAAGRPAGADGDGEDRTRVAGGPASGPGGPRARDGRGLRVGGDVLLGVGFVALGVMAYGVVVHVDSRHKLQSLTDTLVAADRPGTAAERDAGAALERRGATHQGLANAAGVLGGVAVITGAALRVAGVRRARALALAPVVLPRFVGLAARVEF